LEKRLFFSDGLQAHFSVMIGAVEKAFDTLDIQPERVTNGQFG
jgi:hypothetical protein